MTHNVPHNVSQFVLKALLFQYYFLYLGPNFGYCFVRLFKHALQTLQFVTPFIYAL